MNKINFKVLSGPEFEVEINNDDFEQVIKIRRAQINIAERKFIKANCEDGCENSFYLLFDSETTLIFVCDPYFKFNIIEDFFKSRNEYSINSLSDMGASYSGYYLNKYNKCSKQSYLSHIFNSIERYKLVDKLSSNKFAEDLYWDYQGITSYLLLSCFDILGGSKDWMSFDDWLLSEKKDHITQRADILKEDLESSKELNIASIYKKYKKIYSFKNHL